MGSIQRCGQRCCKFTAVVFGIIAIIFIISGSVLVSQNSNNDWFDYDWDDDHWDKTTKFNGGIAMIVIGCLFAVVTLIFGGCSHCLKEKQPVQTYVQQAPPVQVMMGQPAMGQPAMGQPPVPFNNAPYPVQPAPYGAAYPMNMVPPPYPSQQILPSYVEATAFPILPKSAEAGYQQQQAPPPGPTAPPMHPENDLPEKM